LDEGGLQHVQIIAPDGGGGGMDAIAREMASNPQIKRAIGALGSHYPGAKGTSPAVRAAGVPAWSAEDYSTYSDATGAGCWGRLLVQNMGWELSATISWYLLGSFARGMDYDSDGSKSPRPIRSAPTPTTESSPVRCPMRGRGRV
jgi:galactosylceramidase